MINLTTSLHYATFLTYVDEYESKKCACISPEKLSELLPHGSGINGDWFIQVHNNGNIKVNGEYHVMNDDGYYTRWINFSFRIYRAKKDRIHALSGLMEGKKQVIERAGDVLMSGILMGGARGNDLYGLPDYLYDTISYSIGPILTKRVNEII